MDEDIQKGPIVLEKRRDANRRYYLKCAGKVAESQAEKEARDIETARRHLEAYEKRNAMLKQQRLERGLKYKAKSFATPERAAYVHNLLTELDQIDVLRLTLA